MEDYNKNNSTFYGKHALDFVDKIILIFWIVFVVYIECVRVVFEDNATGFFNLDLYCIKIDRKMYKRLRG